MARTLASPDSIASTPFVPTRRRRTKEQMAEAAKEVAAIMAQAAQEVENAPKQPEIVVEPLALRIPDEIPSPPVDSEFQADVLEFHQPVELMGNQKTLSQQRSIMTRLSDGTGDWLIQSKKTKHRYLVSAGNVKAAKLK